MPLLSFPLALIGLAALPALAAIYWLRSRSRRYVVSSLMLWVDQRKAHQGGRIMQRMQAPLLLLLEILAMALLVAAAAGLMFPRRGVSRPVVIVLDDSFSMLAGEADNNARSRAVETISELFEDSQYAGRFILAGREPKLLETRVTSAEQVGELLAAWKCQSIETNLARAVSLAGQIAGSRSRILVISDHPPADEILGGRMERWSFGRKIGNVAIVNATRSPHDDRERILLEVANLSAGPSRTTLWIKGGGRKTDGRSHMTLAAGEVRRVVFDIAAGSPALHAALGPDALDFDNQAVLLSEKAKPIRVRLDVGDPTLRKAFTKALDASQSALMATSRCELRITDQAGNAGIGEPAEWQLNVLNAAEASAYAGPFVLDRSHPLTEGLDLDGVIWGAGKKLTPAGAPIISVGNTVLLADQERFDGRHDMELALTPKFSTMIDNPNWPILIWNLLRWRASHLPGMTRRNVRVGGRASLKLPAQVENVQITRPDGEQFDLPVRNMRAEIVTDQPGIYKVQSGPSEWTLASNAISREESDMSGCATGKWGDWSEQDIFAHELTDISWLLALAALAVLTGHLALIARSSSGGSR